MANYDIVGNIAIVKFDEKTKAREKKKIADVILKEHKSVKTVLEKKDRIKGRLRTPTTQWVLGEKTKEALYKENGCIFRFNVDSCYFSPRLSTERREIAESVKKKEKVLVMFGGVAPFAIAIAKLSKPESVVSVELGKNCYKYAKENVKLNKVNNLEVFQGDVRRILGSGKKINEKFDRIVMARPNLRDSFLDIAFSVIKKKGMIHYYGFGSVEDVETNSCLKELVKAEAEKAGRKIKIVNMKRAGDIAPYKYRYRVDFRVLD